MLLGNGHLQNKLPVSFMGGGTISGNRANFGRGKLRNWFVGPHSPDKKSGLPTGYLAGGSWCLPLSAGGMSSYANASGSGDVSPFSLVAGMALDATVSGSGGINSAIADLIVSAIATISGSGGISDADAKAYLNAMATISGAGGIEATTALSALGWVESMLSGAGSLTGQQYATGELGATIRGYSDLTPEGIRDKVWTALASAYQDSLTMGGKLNAAGSGGVDLVALAQAVLDAAQVTPIHADVQKMNSYDVIGSGVEADKWRGNV